MKGDFGTDRRHLERFSVKAFAVVETLMPGTEKVFQLNTPDISSGGAFFPGQLVSPPPDSYSVRVAIVGMRLCAAGVIGVEGSFGFLGNTSAKWTDVTNPLRIYNFNVLTLGLILRIPIMLDLNSAISIFGGSGGTYSLIGLSSDFTYPYEVLGTHFDDVEPDFGWYGKLGIGFYLSRNFFMDVTAYYSVLNAKYGGKQLDGTYLFLAVAFGLAF
jgi:opacity protein-like surface antigen